MKRTFALSILALTMVGCAHGPVNGFLYSDITVPTGATSNPTGNRIGESCASSILGLVAMGDASIETARRNGGINMITSIDEHYLNYFFYQKSCTVVRGR